MKINRNNYEAFLLDLSEGNLSDEMQSELNSFLASNPDLDDDIIENSSTIEDFLDDNNIDKNLLKFDSINKSNRKYFFIAYHEGDLNTSEQNEVLQFIFTQSRFKKEFDQFSQLKLKSTNEVFKDKKTLHSIADSNNSRGFIYWSSRIAAVLLIGFILNALYQNSNNITTKYVFEERKTDLKPTILHGGTVDITSSLVNNNLKVQSNPNTLVTHNNSKDKFIDEETTNPKHLNTNKSQENLSNNFDKEKTKILKKNPALNLIIANLNQKDNSNENEALKPLPVKNIKTPPSLSAYLGNKAKEKEILTENGRPNLVSLINKGSKSLTGQDILAQSQTEKSNSTIFQLGSLKIERISKK